MKRNEWIRNRDAAGYNWTDLLLALSEVRVHNTACGLMVDASSVASGHMPTQWLLEPGPDGWWRHAASGVAGPLPECLLSITMTCMKDDWRPPDDPAEQEPSGAEHGASPATDT